MPEDILTYNGHCPVCGTWNEFHKEQRSIRETYPCPTCRSTLRYRGQAVAILSAYGTSRSASIADLAQDEQFRRLCIYEPGVMGPFRRYLANLPGYRQSFFCDDVPRGAMRDGIECQDLMRLTYPDSWFDLVITSDIFEHIRRPYVAFREIQRVLKPGGRHIFSIPLTSPMPPETVFRVDASTDEDIYLLEPHYHGNGRGGRALVYTDFGADLIEQLACLGLQTEAIQFDSPYLSLRRLLTFVSRKACKQAG